LNKAIKLIKESKNGIKDVVITTIPNFVSIFSWIVITIMLARALHPAGMGHYALIVSIYTVILSFSDIGIDQITVRFATSELIKNNINNQFMILRWAFRVKLLISLILTILLALIIPIILTKYWHMKELIAITQLSLLIGFFGAFSSVPKVYFQTVKNFKMNAVISVLKSITNIIAVSTIFFAGICTLKNVILILAASSATAAVMFFKLVPVNALFDKDEFGNLIKTNIKNLIKLPELKHLKIHSFTFLYSANSAITSIYENMSIWLAGYFVAASQIGLFVTAYRFSIPILMFIISLNTVFWQRLSENLSQTETLKLLKRLNIFLLMIIPALIIYSIYVPYLSSVLFGSSYKDCVLFGQLLCFDAIIQLIASPLGQAVYNFGIIKIQPFISIFRLLLFIILAWLLLPLYGIVCLPFISIGLNILNIIIWSLFIFYKAVYLQEYVVDK
jgi:O-antigen/teichoic acid export membrane protein